MYFQIGISTQIILNWKVTTSHFGREVIEIYNLSNCDLSRRVCLSIPFNSSLETSLLGLAETA